MADAGVYLEAILLGVIQGLAEFLPISSSGHLVIARSLLGSQAPTAVTRVDGFAMNVALHLGTLFSILVVYRGDLKTLIRQPRLCVMIGIATLPLVVAGLLLHDQIEAIFETPIYAALGLLVTAGLLTAGQRWERQTTGMENIPAGTAIIIGLFQALALVPGISRSGSTIAGGLLCGMERRPAANFSFLIAIPAICGAVILAGVKVLRDPAGLTAAPILLTGAVTSFIVGLAALRWMLRLVTQRKLHWFAIYCTLVAVATLIWQLSLSATAG